MTTEEAKQSLIENYNLVFDDYNYTFEKFQNRHFRFTGQFLQISDTDFDRWANSVEYELDYSRMKEKRFLREVNYFLDL